MHDARRLLTRPSFRRLTAGIVVAFCLMVGAVSVVMAGGGEYNSNPTYCHSASLYDPLWWYFECYLPDPPGTPY